jgi:hypothetical protein
MKAYLEHDIITAWTTNADGVEVGNPPPGVGMERLRYDGEKIVDLADLPSLHATNHSGVFRLHCIAVPDSQPVAMAYGERKKLIKDGSVYRAKTDIEVVEATKDHANKMLKANLRRDLDKEMGDTLDLLADVTKCLSLVLVHLAGGTGSTEAKAVIDAIGPSYVGIYPLGHSQASLLHNAEVLKAKMEQYYLDYNL